MITRGCVQISDTNYRIDLTEEDYGYTIIDYQVIPVDRIERTTSEFRPFTNWKAYMESKGLEAQAKRVQKRKWALERLGVRTGDICIGFRV